MVFVDLFTPSKKLYEAGNGPLTINGIHLSDEGYRRLAPILDEALFGPRPASVPADLKALHAAVQEKNLQFFYDYRAVNGCYIYGGRKAPFGIINFPAEFAKLRAMIKNREQRVWDLAKGKSVPPTIDDSNTGDFATVVTNVKNTIHITTPAEELKTFTLPDGLQDRLVRFRGRVSRAGRSGLDDLRRQGPALGRHHAVLSDVSAGYQAQRQGPDPGGRQRRRQGRSMYDVRRRLASAHRHRAGRRRRLPVADAQPDVPQGHQRRRSRRHAAS